MLRDIETSIKPIADEGADDEITDATQMLH